MPEIKDESKREFFAKISAVLGIPLLPTDVVFGDQDSGKVAAIRGQRLLWFVDQDRVNLDDFLNAYGKPGGLIRCEGDPHECVMVYGIPHA